LDDRHHLRKRRVEALATLAESFLATGPRDLSGADRHQIVVHVDAETLQHGHAGRCELERGPSIASETARRLSCDAGVVRIIETEKGEPLDVGRKTRTIPPAIRRALNARDKGCRFPGAFRFTRPDGESIESLLPPTTDWHGLVAMNEAADIQVNPRTAITRWTGESIDYGIAVQVLLEKAERAKHVSAETPSSS
jgi:hypothetical protein